MGFADFLGNGHIVSALRGAMRSRTRAARAALHRPSRRRQIHAGAHVRASRELRAAERRFLRRVRHLPPHRAPRRSAKTSRTRAHRAWRKRRCRHRRAHTSDFAVASRCVGASARPGALKTPVVRPLLRIGQMRAVQRAAYFQPMGKRRVFIVDSAETMRGEVANAFLKILEEPPGSATLVLTASVAQHAFADDRFALPAIPLRSALDRRS